MHTLRSESEALGKDGVGERTMQYVHRPTEVEQRTEADDERKNGSMGGDTELTMAQTTVNRKS